MKRTFPILLILSLFLSCEREPATVSVTGVSLRPDMLTLTEGETAALTATVSPADATDKTVFWSSSSPAVASVSDGTVTALKEGTAEIQVRTKDGGFQATCRVTVKQKIPALIMDPGQDLKPVFDEKGGTFTVSFKTTGSWTATPLGSTTDWIQIDPASGSAGAGSVRFTVAENAGFEDRTASVRIQCEDISETVVISQKQKDDLTVTASQFELGPEGGEVEIEVKSNISYDYQIDGDWIKAVSTRSYQSHILTFTVAPNGTVQEREGSVTFSGAGQTETVRIYQEKPVLTVSGHEFNLPAEVSEFRIEVTSNVDVALEMPEGVSWIRSLETRTLRDEVRLFQVEANPGYDSRSATLRFVNQEFHLCEEVTVTQKQKDGLIVPETERNVAQEGEVFSIDISSNIDFNVRIEGDWIRQIPRTRGMVTETLTFEADPLPAQEFDRTAQIVLSGPGGSPSARISVRQRDGSPLISFKDPEAKRICVKNWDRNGDGELSQREAAAVTNLVSFSFSDITSFEELEFFTGITEIPNHCFYKCVILESIKFPSSLVSIGDSAFLQCNSLQTPPVFPNGLKTIGDDAFSECPSMSGSVILPESISQIGSWAFSYSNSISQIILQSREIPLLGKGTFDSTDFRIIVPAGTATSYQEAEGWNAYKMRITEEGHDPWEFYYTSTDYSRDGEVVCLQEATRGKGINLIFIGDGFVDKDMVPGGKYEDLMRRAMEQYFLYEPYKTYREWFTVYTVKVVSRNDCFRAEGSDRRLSRDLKEGEVSEDSYANRNKIQVSEDACWEYANRVPDPYGQGRKVAVFFNGHLTGVRDHCHFWSSGKCLAFLFNDFDRRPTTLNHELGGHGFAWLGDEYLERGSTKVFNDPDLYDSRFEKYAFYPNLDWRNNPVTIRWSPFLQDSRYAGEGLGIFEGGNGYAYGIYHPTFNSMMGSDYQAGAVFNAPCREAIYKNIMRWGVGADWEYDYEAFVKADEAGRKQAAEAYAMYPPTRSLVERREDFEPGLPPIMTDDTSVSPSFSISRNSLP